MPAGEGHTGMKENGLRELRNLPTTVEPGDSGSDQGMQGNGDR
jgi:hypothetical protein